jgi:glucose-6-phosphate isomerase
MMANQLVPMLTAGGAPTVDQDSSTNALITRYRAQRGRRTS